MSFPNKINSVCGALDSLGKKKFGDLPKQIAKTKFLLQDLQRSVQTAETIEATRRAEADLDTLLEQEEVFWSQRSRAMIGYSQVYEFYPVIKFIDPQGLWLFKFKFSFRVS